MDQHSAAARRERPNHAFASNPHDASAVSRAGAGARLDTPRLTLSPLGPDDTAELHGMWTGAGVRRYLWDDMVIPRERTADIIARSAELFLERGFGLWGARLRDSASAGGAGRLAGFAGFWYFRDPPELELLYGIAEPLWGRGLATEVGRAMVDYAWAPLAFTMVQASTDAGNVASARVLEKLGFTHTRRAHVGGLDTLFYQISYPDRSSRGKDA